MRTRAGEQAGAKENGAEAKRTRCAGERQGAGRKLCAQDQRGSSPEFRERERERERCVLPVRVRTRFLRFHSPLSSLSLALRERIGRRIMEGNVVPFRRTAIAREIAVARLVEAIT